MRETTLFEDLLYRLKLSPSLLLDMSPQASCPTSPRLSFSITNVGNPTFLKGGLGGTNHLHQHLKVRMFKLKSVSYTKA